MRQIIDAYLKKVENKDLSYEPYNKIIPVGFEHLARTITKEQDKSLRLLADKTGRSITELVREAVNNSLQ